MKFISFKPFFGEKASAQASPQSSHARRKEQVRRAQKTLRERKEAYVKSLEVEVVQLRTNEVKILHQARCMHKQIITLKKLLEKNGIDHTGLSDQNEWRSGDVPDSPFEFTIGADHVEPRINVRRHIAEQKSFQIPWPHDEATSTPFIDHLGSSEPSHIPQREVPPNPHNSKPLPKTPHVQDHTDIGIDFILSLESPCLTHIPATSPTSSTGHSLMLSATILHHHHGHDHSAHTQQQTHTHHEPWTISSSGIQRLLESSATMPLSDGELTPVQAWDQLRRHPEFETLEREKLEKVRDGLSGWVICYGFGGVVTQEAFDNVVGDVFSR